MTANDLLEQYAEGRRQFSGEILSGENIFLASLRRTHPELIDRDIAELIRTNAPVMSRPLGGPNLSETDFSEGDLVRANLARANFFDANLSSADLRLSFLRASCFEQANLQEADLTSADLASANMRGSNLTGAKLGRAILDRADLDGANFQFARMDGAQLSRASAREAVFKGTNLRGANLLFAVLDRADLEAANLRHANLARVSAVATGFSHARLHRASLQDALLRQANFRSATMHNVDLARATLTDADLSGADLDGASLAGADLQRASFSDATLTGVDFSGANLEGASLDGALLGGTLIPDIDLSPFLRAGLRHRGITTVGFRALVLTVARHTSRPSDPAPYPDVREFLLSCGTPQIFTDYMIDCARTLDQREMYSIMQSTFISYGGPDEAFAERLNEELRANGVTTFFFPAHAEFGEKLHRVMRRVNDYDRIILVCSRNSMNRKGVLNEIEKTLEREARDGGENYLLPIALDTYVFDGWDPSRPDLRDEVLNRVVADFTDEAQFETQLRRLLLALRKRDPLSPGTM